MKHQIFGWLWKFMLTAAMLLSLMGCRKNAPPAEENQGGAFVTQLPDFSELAAERDAENLKHATDLNGMNNKSNKDSLKGILKKPETTPKEEPKVTKAPAQKKKPTDILGEFRTYYGDSSAARSSNIETAAKKINGTVLQPGEAFSCHDALAPFTKENGYQAAGAFSGGKIVDSVGGGVCQVSTTLYNAVLLAELKVTSRSAHSMTVSYVDLSRDAAIAGDYKDLKFVNNLDQPVTIRAVLNDGWLTFRIEGKETRDPDRSIEFETVVLSKEEPGEDVVSVDEDRSSDYSKVTQKAHIGYQTELYKIVTENGKEKERIRINQSNYEASPKYITVGGSKEPEK